LLGNAQYVYVPPAAPYPIIPRDQPLVVDEADRLPRASRRHLLAASGLVAIATHRDVSRIFPQNQYEVLTLNIANLGNPVRLAAMLNRRIRASSSDTGPTPRISILQATELIGRFGDDIRAIEEYLYEAFQQLEVTSHGQMRLDDRTSRPS
jgi:Rad3-related DNA helicase